MSTQIPEEAATKLAVIAGEEIKKLIKPATALMKGIGNLIEYKFQQLLQYQKIIASETIKNTVRKVNHFKESKESNTVIKAEVFYKAFDNTESQADATMQALWSNLLAREILEGSVHPYIAELLGKLTTVDAILLANYAVFNESSLKIRVLKVLKGDLNKNITFTHEYLEKLGLIRKIKDTKSYHITPTGLELINCISDL